MEGPISWITSGKVDAVLDIKFPRDPNDELPFNAILGEIADAISTSLSGSQDVTRIPGQRELVKPALSVPEDRDEGDPEGDSRPKVMVDIDLRFRDLKAAVPIFPEDLSYVNYALIRPIVAFMKSVVSSCDTLERSNNTFSNSANRTLVPIHCRVVKDLSDFDGAWTVSVCLQQWLILNLSIDFFRCGKVSLGSLYCDEHLQIPSFHLAGLMDEISVKVNTSNNCGPMIY